MRFDTIWLDARIATLAPGRPGLGVVERGAIAATDGRIVYAGPMVGTAEGGTRRERLSSTAAGSRPG